MTLDGVMALILRYFTDVVVKKFTIAIASPDEFLLTKALQYRMLAECTLKIDFHQLVNCS